MRRSTHLAALLFLLAAAARRGDAAVIEAREDRIYIDGAPLFLKGICYSPYIAGDAPWIGQYKVDFAKDLHDIKKDLNANAVRIYDPLPKAFYDAARAEGVWVIQGFYVPDTADVGARVAPRFLREPNYVDAQRNMIRAKIDQVHDAGGLDVVLAYVIGSGMATDVVASTISSVENQEEKPFKGEHYTVPAATELPNVDCHPGCCPPTDPPPPKVEFKSPHPFQSFIAELSDVAYRHEQAHYQTSHLIGHAAAPATNSFLGGRDRAYVAPLTLEPPVDFGFLDIIFENLSTYGTEYLTYYGYPAYLERLKIAHPGKPVVVLETGYSTSPTAWPLNPPFCGFPRKTPLPLGLQFGGCSEDEQAQALEARWVDVVSTPRPLAGFFVYEYYEEWWLGGNPAVQVDNPLGYFGLMRVRGTPGAFTASPKPAFFKVAALFGCEESDADPIGCALVIRTPRALHATYGRPLDLDLVAEGKRPPYFFSIPSGDKLPSGVTLDAARGKLIGEPDRVGSSRFRLRVEDSDMPPRTVTRWESLAVAPPEFIVSGRQILLKSGDPRFPDGKEFFLKGIDYSPFTAGDLPWTGLTHLDPAVDMREIRENLHANCIRVYQALPKSVYDAARDNGLFVIQGIHLQVNEGERDLFDQVVFQRTRQHVLDEVNDVHNSFAGDLVLAWVVGNEIDSGAQRGTIDKYQANPPRYKGTYYSAPPPPARLPEIDYGPNWTCPAVNMFLDPLPLQSFVAEMVDTAAVLLAQRYGVRHLMSHATEPTSAIIPSARYRFQPEFNYPVDMGFFDIIFQNVYSYHPPYIRYFGYQNYLQKVAETYPDKPFVILECGYSLCPNYDAFIQACAAVGNTCAYTGDPAPGSFCFGKNTEEDQATGLGKCYREATEDPKVAGFFVFEWNDEWWKGSQRSEHCRDRDRVEEWFGLKDVDDGTADPLDCGDSSKFKTRNRLAYRTVGKMYEQDWCPSADQVTCTVKGLEVEVSLVADNVDSAILYRDGEALAVLRGTLSFTDRPLPGAHVYSLVAESDRAQCAPITCTVNLESKFRRGDSSPDGTVDITDVVVTLGYLYLDGRLDCQDAADANNDGAIDITDPIFVLNFLFLSGDPIPSPGPFRCGPDEVADLFPPCSYPPGLCP